MGIRREVLRLLVSASLGILILAAASLGSVQTFGGIKPGFHGSQMNWIDHNGLFLVSNSSNFAFGFITTPNDVTLFFLVVMHYQSRRVVWTANSKSPVSNTDKFAFDEAGKVSLQKGSDAVWSIGDGDGGGATELRMLDSGNLVLVGGGGRVSWESFSHPTDTLVWGQEFSEGMRLVSNPDPKSSKNLSYFLQIGSGDATLYAGFETPQPYWSMGKDSRRTINKDGTVATAVIEDNSWKFYDKQRDSLLWQFIIAEDSPSSENATWILVLGSDGVVSFSDLRQASSGGGGKRIPSEVCSTPEHCDAFYECLGDSKCQCPSGLASRSECSAGIVRTCNNASAEMISAGDDLYYFALGFVPPTLEGSDLGGCKTSCLGNCSCVAAFFHNSTGHCFLFDRLGNFQNSDRDSSGFVSYVKVSSASADGGGGGGNSKGFPYVAIIVVGTVLVICLMLFFGYRYQKKKTKKKTKSRRRSSRAGTGHESSDSDEDEDNFLGNLSGMPIRFTYDELDSATNGFTEKLGQGGFGSVYLGELKDGTKLAVKKLEGIGQGKKEFRAEVSIIGSIHHLHLVRLRGFCAEGHHRLLAYEFMAKGSLDRWIFRRKKGEDHPLDWPTRFAIAVGTAKGLAYLHEDCDSKIIHCDIKPENVLLDQNFHAKVSDFGLAKLMTREQSHVFTTMRGTRGYLAPEWITNYAISEKSDVYSYGMLLLEIVGGRKNYDPTEASEKSHFPSYAFKMLEEGKLRDVLDASGGTHGEDESVSDAVKVALWCIQEDMSARPSMTKVVQMLEGLCPVPPPPTSTPVRARFFSGMFNSSSEAGTSSAPSDYNSDAYLSAVRLSGPR